MAVQFHHHGYVSGDPRVQPAAGVGIEASEELPEEVDVLIIGAGPAGMITAAQLSQFPNVTTRITERRSGRLEVGHADGIQGRSVETFQAFGFAGRIMEEAYRVATMLFWKPDPHNPSHIVRATRKPHDPTGVSEYPHLLVNQARVQDYFAEFMANSPARLKPDYGLEFVDLDVADDSEHPVTVTLRHTTGPRTGRMRTVGAKYVVGCDGAHSRVRNAIGRELVGDQALHAWGVMDVLTDTDFPDIRTKCAIQSHDGGSILLIPREGGHLVRLYVDLGEVSVENGGAIRNTTPDEIVSRANQILRPYTIEVRHIAWHSVYEVGHRITDKFDDVPPERIGTRTPRVFIAGDACHTHSAKAGQGMNVSMQDGFNIAWKLGHVLDGRAPESLLDTYSAERQVVAQNLIDFDKQWSSLMATKPEDLEDPSQLEEVYVRTFEFQAGFVTQYQPSVVTSEAEHQVFAAGFPVGKRFKSAPVVRVCDANPVHLGHQARADGRWRLYAFAATAPPGEPSALTDFAEWIAHSPSSPVLAYRPGADNDTWFDVKVIYQQRFEDVDLGRVPEAFLPRTGPFRLVDYEKVYAADVEQDIFDLRGIDRAGALVVVRPDQYVANVLPLTATADLAEFFERVLLRKGIAIA